MRLIGSRAEQRLRSELISSNLAFRDNSRDPRFITALKEENVDFETIYVLDWVPEQTEDIYVLLALDEVLFVEVPREQGHVQVDRQSLAEYAKKCSKDQRMKIAVAQDLVTRKGMKPSQ